MSNKIVPQIYRAVIEDVMNGIKPEFEEYGVGDDVFRELQAKWEKKVIDSHVAEFEQPTQAPVQPQHYHPPHPILMPGGPHYAAHYAAAASGQVKTEPVDPRYVLSTPGGQPMQYSIPSLPGPQLNGVATVGRPQYGGQTSVLSFPAGRPYIPPTTAAASSSSHLAPPAPTATNGSRIPQVDGPSEDSDDSPSPPSYAPRSMHPSLPQPQSQQDTSGSAGDEAINSDLDDSDEGEDEEADEGTTHDADIVFCTYDKVARVKNKWKCILKDGMVHVNGKDYLFSKCTGEFEW